MNSKRIVALVIFVLGLGVCLSPVGEGLDHFVYDTLFVLRGRRPPPEDLVIVTIDEPSFALLEMQWPWPRGVHAELLDVLFEGGARAVALDLLFSEPSDPVEDSRLKCTLASHPEAVLATAWDHLASERFCREIFVKPHENIAGPHTDMGFINIHADGDGVIRRAFLARDHEVCLALQTISQSIDILNFHADGWNNAGINYYGPAGTLRMVSYYQALDSVTHLPRDFWRGKIVFVGYHVQTSPLLAAPATDHYRIPYSRRNMGLMSGVEIHATIAGNILEDGFIRSVPKSFLMLAGVFLGGFLVAWVVSFRPVYGLGFFIVVSVLMSGVAWFLFEQREIYIPVQVVLVPLLGAYAVSPFYHYTMLWQEKLMIRKAFSKYVSPQIIGQIMKDPSGLALGGVERAITAFFADLADFTSISEQLKPSELVTLLNKFFTEMTGIILKNLGTVDKFEGDAIVAFWGAPVFQRDHADLACHSALVMQQLLARLRKVWGEQGYPELHMRIGICSGFAVVGNMGSKQHMNYTMMGDTVNTASRLESVNKVYKTTILMCEPTRSLLYGEFVTRKVDLIRVAGKSKSVWIFELIGYEADVPFRVREAVGLYEKGIAAYQTRDFDHAIELFCKVLDRVPEDGPAKVMVERCHSMKKNPPPRSWDGVYTLASK